MVRAVGFFGDPELTLKIERFAFHQRDLFVANPPWCSDSISACRDQRSGRQAGRGTNLFDAVKQQSGVLDGFANMIGGGKQSSLLDQGSTLLKSLLGSKDQSALAGAVSKFAGLGQNTGNQKATSISRAVVS